MSNEPVAYAWCKNGKMLSAMIGKYEPIKTDLYWLENGFDAIPLYTHPAKPIKDREADRKRFSDEGLNRWLDESISDSGHTVYDLVENVCEAWHGWENSQYYKPAKTLTDEEIIEVFESPFHPNITGKINDEVIAFARAILRKANEK